MYVFIDVCKCIYVCLSLYPCSPFSFIVCCFFFFIFSQRHIRLLFSSAHVIVIFQLKVDT